MAQKIINGLAQLPTILKEVGCKRLFLVVDSSYPFLNIKDAIEALPVKEKVMFSDFTPNPLYEQVCNGIELLCQNVSFCMTRNILAYLTRHAGCLSSFLRARLRSGGVFRTGCLAFQKGKFGNSVSQVL